MRVPPCLMVAFLACLPSPQAEAPSHLVSQDLGGSAYTASSTYDVFTPDLAFDGDFDTHWNAAAHTGWIEVDLNQTYELSRVEMTLQISPDGQASYEVWISDLPIEDNIAAATLAYQYSGNVQMNDVFIHVFDEYTYARFLQVRTVGSVGWAAWREIRVFEVCVDNDSDGFFFPSGCGSPQDCNDADSLVNPDATEVCNDIDDNCNDLTDEDELGEDTDGDDVHNLCDNCRDAFNPSQTDSDNDTVGNGCDNCLFIANPLQEDLDSDGRGDGCDNCPATHNPLQDDWEEDGVGDSCDNCFDTWNPSQSDVDADFEGDHCDLDDGLIYITFKIKSRVLWQEETGYLTWNAYRGDLAVLTATGVYTQIPGSNDLAGRECALLDPFWQGIGVPDDGEVAFFLATGVNIQGESDLGTDSAGETRPSDNPCP